MTIATKLDRHEITNLNRLVAKRSRRRSTLIGWCFLLPSFIGFVIFRFLPIICSFLLGFTEWNLVSGFSGIKFAGIDNFIELFHNDTFLTSLLHTFQYAVIVVPFTVVLALIFAVIINDKIHCRSLVRLMIYMPYISSMVAVAMVWTSLYSPNYGPINSLLRSVGIENVPGWITSSKSALPALMIIGVWQAVGYYMVLFIAGLQCIPASLYEAAEIDGANAVQCFFKITIPMVSPTTFFVLINCIIGSFNVFTLVKVMTTGGPGDSTMVTVYYVYEQAVEYNKIGYACSASIILFFFVFIITFIQLKFSDKWVHEG